MKLRLLHGAVAAAWGLVVSIGAYGLIRIAQSLLYPDPNPALIAWSPHSGYFWRVAIVAYAGGIGAFVVPLLARGALDRAARALVPAVTVVTAILVLQAALFP
jgi:hypothetical protein